MAANVPWLEFLKHWHEQGIGDLPGPLRRARRPSRGAKKQQWGGYDVKVSSAQSLAIEQGDDKFVVIESGGQSTRGIEPHQFLRYSTAATPGKPPGGATNRDRAKGQCEIRPCRPTSRPSSRRRRRQRGPAGCQRRTNSPRSADNALVFARGDRPRLDGRIESRDLPSAISCPRRCATLWE